MTLWIFWIILFYGRLVYFILKVFAWEICSMKWGFVKKVIIMSQRQFMYNSYFYGSDVRKCICTATLKHWPSINNHFFFFLFQLKEAKSDKTVIAFLIFPTKTNSFNVESLRGHAVAKGLKDTIDDIQREMGERLYETCLRYL